MQARLTKRLIDSLEPDPERNTLVWDDEVPGLLLVVARGGTKSYAVDYRTADGRRRRKTLGRHPELNPTTARERARRHRVEVSDGGDPLQERQTARKAPTLEDLKTRFIEDHGAKRAPRTREDYRAHFDRYILPALGRLTPVNSVRWEDVADLHATVSLRAPTQANRMLSTGSKAWSLATKWGWWPRNQPNPWRDHDKNEEGQPGRALDGTELWRLGKALKADSSLAARGLELLLLTGARPGELRTARWEMLDGRLLRLPVAKTGQRSIFLGIVALKRLQALPRLCDYIFPGADKTPFVDWNNSWNKARDAARLACRAYDLRHTYTSTAAALGIDPDHVRSLSGHAPRQEAHQRYLHPAAHPDLRDLLLADADVVAALLAAALRGEKDTTKVLHYPKSA